MFYKLTGMALCGILTLSLASRVAAQECSRLESGSLNGLVSYLNGVKDQRQDAPCVAFAIKKLGERKYESAIPTLAKFLDFRWPLEARQKQRLYVLEHDGATIYPAADAMEKIGTNSLPALLNAVKSDPMSRESMEVAISVWMTIYKNQAPVGVAALKEEADKATELGAKQRFRWAALHAAMFWCGPADREQCKAHVRVNNVSPPNTVPQSSEVGRPIPK